MKTEHFRRDDPATDPGGSCSTKPVLATVRLTVKELASYNPLTQPATPPKDTSPMNTTTPAQASGLTASEMLDLERLRRALPKLTIAAEQAQTAHAFNGGDAGAQRKAAFEAQLRASGNMHSK